MSFLSWLDKEVSIGLLQDRVGKGSYVSKLLLVNSAQHSYIALRLRSWDDAQFSSSDEEMLLGLHTGGGFATTNDLTTGEHSHTSS